MYDPADLTLLPGWLPDCLPIDLVYHGGYFPHQKLTESKLRQAMAYYYATISQIDAQVGRLVACLKAQARYDNTLVLFTSDHGEFLGFHHLLLKGNYMYDPLIKVPLVVKFPRQDRAGEESAELVSGVDIAPTLLEVAGCSVPSSMIGRSLLNASNRDLIFAESNGGRDYMVRTRRYKLLLCHNDAQSQFFDLAEDPLEMVNQLHNVAYQDEIVRLREALLHWLAFECRSPVHLDEQALTIQGPNVPVVTPARRERAVDYFRKQMDQDYDYAQ